MAAQVTPTFFILQYDVESNELIDSNPSSLARVISTLLVTRTVGHDVYTCLVSAGAKTARATTVVYSTGEFLFRIPYQKVYQRNL